MAPYFEWGFNVFLSKGSSLAMAKAIAQKKYGSWKNLCLSKPNQKQGWEFQISFYLCDIANHTLFMGGYDW